jgi:NADH dehydrogenase
MIPSKQALPGLCPVAIQQGQYLSKYLLGINKLPFQYVDKGIMATIGRKKAIAEIGKIKLSGFIAWCAWLFVHIFYLIGFKNRFFVFMQWVWSYITFSRGARLITGKNWKLND